MYGFVFSSLGGFIKDGGEAKVVEVTVVVYACEYAGLAVVYAGGAGAVVCVVVWYVIEYEYSATSVMSSSAIECSACSVDSSESSSALVGAGAASYCESVKCSSDSAGRGAPSDV